MSGLIEIANQLVHPQRVSAITCIQTTPDHDEIDEEGVAWKNGREYVKQKTGQYEYIDTPRAKHVGRPFWTISISLSGGGVVRVGSVVAESWLDDAQLIARNEAIATRDRTAVMLGLTVDVVVVP